MVSLADIYSRNNRTEDAKRIAEEIGKLVPDDAQKILDHAQLLRQVGMRDEAMDWTCKAIEKEPARLFNDFWEYERTFRNAKETNRLIELIRNMDATVIEDRIHQIGNYLSQWMQAELTRETTLQLLDSLWNNEKASEEQRENIRDILAMQMASEPRKEYYSYLKESAFGKLIHSPPEDQVEENLDISFVYEALFNYNNTMFDMDDALIKSAKAAGTLEVMKTELLEIIATHEADDPVKDISAYARALLFETQIALSEKNFDRTKELLTKIFSDERIKKQADSLASFLAVRILDTPNIDKTIIEMIIERFEKQFDDPKMARQRETNPTVKKMLADLHFKSDQPERGKGLAVSGLRQSLQYAKKCSDNYEIEIDGATYSMNQLSELVAEYVVLLKNAGCDFEIWLVFQAECAGQEWYKDMEQYAARQLKQSFEGVEDGVLPKDVAKHIELLIPDLVDDQVDNDVVAAFEDMMPTDSVNLAVDCKTVNTTADGAIRNAFRLLAEAAMQPEGKSLHSSMISSKLLDALKFVAAEDKAKFDRIVETLDRSAAEHPTEPTFVIARLYCALASNDANAASEQMAQVADWVGSLPEEKSLQFEYHIYLGFWLALREVYSDVEKYDAEQFASSNKKLLRWLNEAKSIGYNDDGTLSSAEPQLIPNQVVNAMTFEMQRILPDEVKVFFP